MKCWNFIIRAICYHIIKQHPRNQKFSFNVFLLTLFGIICHDRLFPLIVLFDVFSYSSLGCDVWLENVNVDADMLIVIDGWEHGEAIGDGELQPVSKSTTFRRFPGQIPLRPRSEHSHQPSNPSVFCSMTSKISPLRNANSSTVSAMLS